MSEKFKAIVLNQSDKKFSREIQNLDKGFFKTGDVFVKIDYSSLNYKDALILKNGAKLKSLLIYIYFKKLHTVALNSRK